MEMNKQGNLEKWQFKSNLQIMIILCIHKIDLLSGCDAWD